MNEWMVDIFVYSFNIKNQQENELFSASYKTISKYKRQQIWKVVQIFYNEYFWSHKKRKARISTTVSLKMLKRIRLLKKIMI